MRHQNMPPSVQRRRKISLYSHELPHRPCLGLPRRRALLDLLHSHSCCGRPLACPVHLPVNMDTKPAAIASASAALVSQCCPLLLLNSTLPPRSWKIFTPTQTRAGQASSPLASRQRHYVEVGAAAAAAKGGQSSSGMRIAMLQPEFSRVF
ncbi:uncharacterized protein LOC144108805 [Amblyomma americanum]